MHSVSELRIEGLTLGLRGDEGGWGGNPLERHLRKALTGCRLLGRFRFAVRVASLPQRLIARVKSRGVSTARPGILRFTQIFTSRSMLPMSKSCERGGKTGEGISSPP